MFFSRIVELEADCKRGGVTSAHSKAGEFKLTPEMEKDMSKMIVTISELERKNLELTTQVKQLETKVTPKPNFVGKLIEKQVKRGSFSNFDGVCQMFFFELKDVISKLRKKIIFPRGNCTVLQLPHVVR